MAKKVSQAKLDKISARREKRAANKATRKDNRTKKLAARKGISESQAKDLQANRKQRFQEFAQGGLEGIKTGRLRFNDSSSLDAKADAEQGAKNLGASIEGSASGLNNVNTNLSGGAGIGGSIADRSGTMDTSLPMTGRGGVDYSVLGQTQQGGLNQGPGSAFKRKGGTLPGMSGMKGRSGKEY